MAAASLAIDVPGTGRSKPDEVDGWTGALSRGPSLLSMCMPIANSRFPLQASRNLFPTTASAPGGEKIN